MSERTSRSLLINCNEYEEYNLFQRQFITKKNILSYVMYIAKYIKDYEVDEIVLIFYGMNGIDKYEYKDEDVLEITNYIYVEDKDDLVDNIIMLEVVLRESLENKEYIHGFKYSTNNFIYKIDIRY
jgi:hypothetical protein